LENLLAKPAVSVYNRTALFLQLDQPFTAAGIQYYASPQNLPLNGIVSQLVAFAAGSDMVIREWRFFEYDVHTGILVKLDAESVVLVNSTAVARIAASLNLTETAASSAQLRTLDSNNIAVAALAVNAILLALSVKKCFSRASTTSETYTRHHAEL